MTDLVVYLGAFLTGVIAVARATRLTTHDSYPPAVWVRHRFIDWTHNGRPWRIGWEDLVTCPFCFAPYAAAVNLTWAAVVGVDGATPWSVGWWLVNVWAAGSYLAAVFVVRDEPED